MLESHAESAKLLQQDGIAVVDSGPIDWSFDLNLEYVVVDGCDALRAWRVLRNCVPRTGRWPIVLGGEPALDSSRDCGCLRNRLKSAAKSVAPHKLASIVADWLAQAERLPFDQWLTNQRDPQWKASNYLQIAEKFDTVPSCESMARLYRQFAANWANAKPEVFDPEKIRWPSKEVAPVTKLSVLEYVSDEEDSKGQGKPQLLMYDRAVIALLPTIKGWEAPAYLFFGGFNSCPTPDVHVAMAQWANERHAAEVVAIGSDTIEFQCFRPPATREEAFLLARDLMSYAEEVFFNSEKDLPLLASALKNGSIWSCWWD